MPCACACVRVLAHVLVAVGRLRIHQAHRFNRQHDIVGQVSRVPMKPSAQSARGAPTRPQARSAIFCIDPRSTAVLLGARERLQGPREQSWMWRQPGLSWRPLHARGRTQQGLCIAHVFVCEGAPPLGYACQLQGLCMQLEGSGCARPPSSARTAACTCVPRARAGASLLWAGPCRSANGRGNFGKRLAVQ